VSTFHLAYGLRILADRPIPGLVPSALPHAEIDLRVHMGHPRGFFAPSPSSDAEIFYCGSHVDDHGQPSLRVAAISNGEFIGFFYRDGARFAIHRSGGELWADWPEGYCIEDAATYLVGPVLGFILRLKGVTPLHASSVAIDDQAIALVGAPGAGKSTTAATFARRGFPVLSDDVVPLRCRGDEFLVAPGYPRVNLWPDSVDTLLGSEDALPRITPTWGKHYLPLDHGSGHFERRPLPLGAIYLLGERDPGFSAPRIEAVSLSEALIALVANTYVNYVLDRGMRQREFELLAHLVAHIPVRKIYPSADPQAVFQMCEMLAEDARRHRNLAPAAMAQGTV
jgi:hypothetical protein